MIDKEFLRNEIDTLKQAMASCTIEIGTLPEGSLTSTKDKLGNKRYYHAYTDESGKYVRRGIGRNAELKQALARKGYLQKLRDAISVNVKTLEKAERSLIPMGFDCVVSRLRFGARDMELNDYLKSSLGQVYLSLSEELQDRILSHVEWGRQPYSRSSAYVENLTLTTSRGERMRSKSELLMAERLYAYGIPFRYEQLVWVGTRELSPDFTFEGRDGQEFYLELCGMMDDPEYVESFQQRRLLYEKSGISEWSGRMIYFYSSGNDMDMTDVDKLIEERVIPKL